MLLNSAESVEHDRSDPFKTLWEVWSDHQSGISRLFLLPLARFTLRLKTGAVDRVLSVSQRAIQPLLSNEVESSVMLKG